ncbi:PEP-utilizing enzyme [Kribbella sp. NBC_01505]|uniref:PEP/pyruvate-binding domain-containing protein n=1 Tax=Kribbella sp. NBC_01505 TaxID=2903580 RepID=UPI003867686F
MRVVWLAQVGAGDRERVGGKAAGLGALIQAGFAVPDGFVVTDPVDGPEALAEVAAAYEELGTGPVAVRSSSTAEDLAEASFAGQYDTFLEVRGLPEVLRAIEKCRASLEADRAVRYRAANGIGTAEIAVIVQRMVDARSAGVLFTANPVSGHRGEMVLEAAEGLGEAVVTGTVVPHRYVLPRTTASRTSGPLSAAEVEDLGLIGGRLHEVFGGPQDAEWAIDRTGRLWLTQTRPITSLFPVPTPYGGLRAYWSVNVYQGLTRPFTPLGVVVMRARQHALEESLTAKGFDPELVEVDGWLYWDITAGLGDETKVRGAVAFADALASPSGQLIAEAARRPEFAPVPASRPVRRKTRWDRVVLAALFPGFASRRVRRRADQLVHGFVGPVEAAPEQRLAYVETTYRAVCRTEVSLPRGANQAGGIAQDLAGRLLAGVVSAAELGAVFRGVPGNPTSEMDLALWEVARRTRAERVLDELGPDELAAEYHRGGLPRPVRSSVADFLAEYGFRVTGEIDFGVPRWVDDPAPVFASLQAYRKAMDAGHDAAEHFEGSARQADATIGDLVGRLPARAVLRRAAARRLLRRSRRLRGLREVPKFTLMRGYQQLRDQLLEVGRSIVDLGILDRADDVMYLDLEEIRAALGGGESRGLVTARRETYRRECLRRRVPSVVLSDGTTVELPAAEPSSGLRLAGIGGSPGVAVGPARVVLDPEDAHLEPGEILVCPSTDPGWTPLFLTAGGLVTETGGMVSHGTTVAREYGIPAVVGVHQATVLIRTGQLIAVDGSHGLVDLRP